jgi:ubiquinone/menaquinone biosynthesis C-methylase UbiE|tara:strand:- start:222 stop:524 length:303 start_codon:yes stop_codon:yes gene_type:complete
MTALTDIQKALNAIRRITQQEAEAVRLEALALMAGVIADEAKDIEKRSEPKPQRSTAQKIKPLPVPSNIKSPSQQQLPQATKDVEPSATDFKSQKPIPPQ